MKPGVDIFMRLGITSVVLAAAFMAAPAPAVADAVFCHGVDFDMKRPLVVSRVTTPARVNFVRGADENASCPSDAPTCRRPDYLVSGDLVLTGKAQPPYVCAAYQSPLARKQNWTNGWLPASALAPVAPSPAPKDSDWTGEWVHPGGSITVAKAGGGMLKVEGLQTYPALLNVHTGVLNAAVRPARDMIAFNEDGSRPFDEGTEGDCLVRMQRIGPWLAVEDNTACGGVMVTFTGLYRRK